MKKYYNQPELEVSEMVVTTIICASLGNGGTTGDIPEPENYPIPGA